MPRGDGAQSQTVKAKLGLRELVLEGAFAPGERVPEIGLAKRLGVSRTPLRLALSTLAHEGLLEPLAGGGFVVRSFTRADVFDGIELRGVLEGTAARLAAERLEFTDELDPLVEAVEQLDDVIEDVTPESLVPTSSSTTPFTAHSSGWPRARRSHGRSLPTPPSHSPRRERCSPPTLHSRARARS
jgi:DNA-binding GntR family transcriptional regulator